MKKKEFYIFSFIALIFLGVISYFYISFYANYEVDENKYSHYIGYINQEKSLLNSKYKLCNKDEIYKTYNGAASLGYKGSKKRFREFIKTNYNSQLYKDSGYLNFRFLVNCEGNAGWFEIIEMNLNLEEQNLDDKMVQELLELTSEQGNWNKLGYDKENNFDYYMYISYRIENGKITEILP